MINAVVVANIEKEAKALTEKLNERFAECVVFEVLSLTKDIIGDIRKKRVDLLVTVDLAGFDRTTFTDGVAYNLLDCKQVHLLLHEKLEYEAYLEKPLSIAMFFGGVGECYVKGLKRKYPEIPWLKELPDWKGDSSQMLTNEMVEAICKLIEDVLLECRLV